jgi:hypothetical protein
MIPIRLGFAFVSLLAFAPSARAQFTPTKVIETGVTYPGFDQFVSFPAAPSISGNRIALPTATASAKQSILTITGGTITEAANFSTPIPSGSGNFTTFAPYPVGLSANGVAFGGQGSPAPGNAGNYTTVTGPVTVVVNNITAFPGGGTFNSFSIPSISGITAVFAGGPAPGTALGVFSRDGTGPLLTVANTSTPVPFGAGNFTAFTDPANGGTLPSVSGPTVVFNGQGGGRFGVYTSVIGSGTATRIADNTVMAPGGAGTFTSFGVTPAINGADVAFFAASPGRTGIYISSGGSLSRIADTTVAVPGGTGNFTSFFTTGVTTSGGRVVFQGIDSAGRAGVYSAFGGSIQKVVAVNDVLDGHTITSLSISDFAYDGGDTVVLVNYSGGSAVYRFTPVPEPAAGLAAAAGFLLLGRTICRRIRKPPEPR